MYPQVFGKYVLECELARGGMARVMLATLRGAGGFEKKLVVKQIRDELACDDEFVRRFVEEAKTTVALAHPNIVPVYELGVELGTYFLAMELVTGSSVAELLRASDPGALSPEEGAYVGVEVCRALDYAHRRMGVVHRDVTPRNVMIDEEGQVKVIDFGIAAPVATAPSGHGVFGSPGHMPPEQMAGCSLTPAADVFAVAALLIEAWSGKAPFRRGSLEGTEAALRAPHPAPSSIDIRLLPLDDVIARALSLDAAARPQNADDLGRVLRRFLVGIDLGDLARKLGDRVRGFRAQPAGPPRGPSTLLHRPSSRPTGVQVATRTFAARGELDVLAPSNVPPLERRAPESSTRRLPSSRPADSPDPANAAEPRKMSRAVSPPDSASPLRSWRPFALYAAGAAAISLLFASFGTRPVASTRPRPVVTSASRAPDPTSPLGLASSGLPAMDASSVSPTHLLAPAAPPPARAQLALFGEGTLVRVDGVAYGACPAHVTLEPGPHAVVFTFPPTGESKEERLKLRPGERAILRADFTTAAPSVRIDR